MKKQLREQFLLERKRIANEQKDARDQKIFERVCANPLFTNASAVLIYVSMPLEVGTEKIIRKALEMKKIVAVPKCHPGTHTMTFHRIENLSCLKAGFAGIKEPPECCPEYLPDEQDLCIVPALAVDRFGNRLGFGGGYYDRFLSEHKLHRMAIVYFLTETLPAEPWDIPMECAITADEESYYK